MRHLVLFLLTIFFIFPRFEMVSAADPDEGYVYLQNMMFYQHGNVLKVLGATIYPSFKPTGQTTTLRGNAWQNSGFGSYIQDMVTLAKQGNLNTIRATNYLEGTTDPYNPIVWNNMDRLFDLAAQNGMYVILDLSSYRNLLRKKNVMPYTYAKWQDFLSFVIPRYSTRKNLLYISIAGEVEAPTGSEPLKATSTQLISFFREVSNQMYLLDQGRHIIQSGGLSFLDFNSGIDWQTIFSLPHIDQASIHVYSDGDRTVTIPQVSTWAKQHNKPLMIDEFGFVQNIGDSIRAQKYTDMFHLVTQNGMAGVIFWNLGPELLGSGYDVNSNFPQTWNVLKTYGAAFLQSGKSADGNNDGTVNGLDYIVWIKNFGIPTMLGTSNGDYNRDGNVNGLDYIVWLRQFGI